MSNGPANPAIQKLIDEYAPKFEKAHNLEVDACALLDVDACTLLDDLDELVHDFKSNEASDINNAGIVAQLEYIIGECIGEDGARETLDKILAGAAKMLAVAATGEEE